MVLFKILNITDQWNQADLLYFPLPRLNMSLVGEGAPAHGD